MNVKLDDVREYLLESNAIEEAEGILLRNILNKSNEQLKRRVVAESLRKVDPSASTAQDANKLDNLKISDLLGSLEADFKESEAKKASKLMTDAPKETPVEIIEKLKFVEDFTEKEIAELEKKRDWMQLKRLANKYELDKMNIIHKTEEPNTSTAAKSRSAPIPFPKNTKETMGQLYELTEEHARKVAQNKAEALVFQRELEMLNKGNWTMSSSYLSSSAAQGSTSANVQPSNHLANGDDYQTRLATILRSVSTEDAVQEQKQEIAAMRQRAAQSDEALRQDPLVQNLTNAIHNSRPTAAAPVDLTSHFVDRKISVPDYLDKWLQGTEGAATTTPVVAEQEPFSAQPSSATPMSFRQLAGKGLALKNGNNGNSRDQLPQNTVSERPTAQAEPTLSSKRLIQGGLQNIQQGQQGGGVSSGSQQRPAPQSEATSRSNLTHKESAPVPPPAAQQPDDAVQALIAKLMEDNRRLTDEKTVLQRDLQRDQRRPREAAQQEMRSPDRYSYNNNPPGGHGAYGGYPAAGAPPGSLNHFRQLQQPIQHMHGDYGYGHGSGGPMNAAPAGIQPFGGPNMYGGGGGYGHNQPMGMPGGGGDPQQQQMMMQLQQMAEQMERENARLMSQLGGPSPDAGFTPPGGNPSAGAAGGGRGIDNSHLYTLERDRQRAGGASGAAVKPSRQELRHQEEVRKIQQDIEKIKYQCELDIAQAEYEQSRSKRLKELEHEKWLQAQRQELQALKIQQVIAKEQRLLRLQQEGGGGPGGGSMDARSASADAMLGEGSMKNAGGENPRTGSAILRDQEREECGAGRVPVPLELATGITVIVDGVILPRSLQAGSLFRIALGLFDKNGGNLVRLTASQWQNWSAVTGNDKQEGPLQHMNELLTRTLKLSDCKIDLANARCLLELQSKDKIDGEQKWIGWSVLPLVRSTTGNNAAINTTVSKNDVVLYNNAWRTVLRKSLSDPAVPDLYARPQSAAYEAWFLLRVVDTSVKTQASSWTLAESSFRSEKQAMSFYIDPLAPADNVPLAMERVMSGKFLEKDPDIKALFASDSANTLNGGANGAGAGAGAGASELNKRGALGAMKAVGIFKSRSKSKMKGELDGITEESANNNDNSNNGMSRKPSTAMVSARNLASPAVPSSAAKSMRGTTPASPALGGFSGLSRKVTEPDAADIADAEDKQKQLLRAADDKTYWFLGKPLGPCNDKYQKGDGVDVYIDSAMFLPDNCTLSRITMRMFAADKEQIGPVHECFSLPNSPSTSPVFKFKAELRMSSFNVTTTALIRIDTIDAATLLPASVGYCCVKLFASRDRVQPKLPTELNACINTGNFQLPLHAGRIPTTLFTLSDTMLSTLPKIPAASLLVRILPAPKSADGISTLSQSEFPSSEWARLGLEVPAPTYVSGEYSGALCEPSDMELVSYRAKSLNPVESVESALLQAVSSKPFEASSLPPKPTGADAEATVTWIKQLLPPHDQMRRSIEYAYAVPYSIETGLNVSVEGLYNMPEGGIFTSHSSIYKVITSMSPPGLFYKDPPLYDGVFYTKTHKMDAHMRAPAFADGFYDFTPSTLSSNLYLLLDVRTLRLDPTKGDVGVKVTLEPPSQRKTYWALLPLSMEKVTGQGYRYIPCGIYQVPLIEGPIPAEDIFKSANPFKELCSRLSTKGKSATNLKVTDGCVITVKVMNPLVKDLILPELDVPKPIIHTEFLEELLKAAILGNSSSHARIDNFMFDPAKFPVGGSKGGKSTASQLPKGCQADLTALVRTVNKEFEMATGLVSR